MSGRSEDSGASNIRTWIRGALVVVVIAGGLGVFGGRTKLGLISLSALQLIGIGIMLASLALVLTAPGLAKRLFAEKRERATVFIKLLGVTLCVAGAALVFI